MCSRTAARSERRSKRNGAARSRRPFAEAATVLTPDYYTALVAESERLERVAQELLARCLRCKTDFVLRVPESRLNHFKRSKVFMTTGATAGVTMAAAGVADATMHAEGRRPFPSASRRRLSRWRCSASTAFDRARR